MPLKQKKYENGDLFKGQLDKNKMIKDDTQGEMKYANGDRYAGYWKNGKRDGYGEMWYANGDYYEGQWQDGVKYELGMMSYNNGDTYDGLWENDSPVDPSRIKHANAKAASPIHMPSPVWKESPAKKRIFSPHTPNYPPPGWISPPNNKDFIQTTNIQTPANVITESVVAVSNIVAVAKKRCPKGTQRNKKTGQCESRNKASPLKMVTPPKPVTKRCPKGTRKNKKTGQCEPK